MLSITAEYALRIMVVLSESVDEPTTSERIAEFTSVPPDYAVKVLQMLARAKLVRAQRGRGGGFRLSCDPAVTSLLEVVRAIEPLDTRKHPNARSNGERGNLEHLYQALDGLVGQFRESLLHTSIADVTRQRAKNRTGGDAGLAGC